MILEPKKFRVVSANVNGIESAVKSGFFDREWIRTADVICVQETRSEKTESIAKKLGYEFVASDPMRENGKRSHGGVAIFSRLPIARQLPIPEPLRQRGQLVGCEIAELSVCSAYVTLGGRADQFSAFDSTFSALVAQDAILCGDFNTFRDQRDSWRFKEAWDREELGCDRTAWSWFSALFKGGWIDIFARRAERPFYTWWHSEQYFLQNKGTRLDYQLVSPPFASSLELITADVKKEMRRGGHAQLYAEYADNRPPPLERGSRRRGEAC